eukprot:scaffold132578_cov37-Prasinocladus_malaysianus.AAC.1
MPICSGGELSDGEGHDRGAREAEEPAAHALVPFRQGRQPGGAHLAAHLHRPGRVQLLPANLTGQGHLQGARQGAAEPVPPGRRGFAPSVCDPGPHNAAAAIGGPQELGQLLSQDAEGFHQCLGQMLPDDYQSGEAGNAL